MKNLMSVSENYHYVTSKDSIPEIKNDHFNWSSQLAIYNIIYI